MSQRVALVTGGTGTLGTQICRSLVQQGRRVVALGHPADEPRLADWQADNAAAGCEVAVRLVDVSRYEAAVGGLESIVAEFGAPTVVVNAAGITRDAALRKMDSADWQAVIAANLDSVFNVVRPLIDGMLAVGFGRIVNISSVNGQKGQFGQTNYSAAKAGMHGFTMALAQEVARKGVTVNTVSPGYIDSPMIRRVPEPVREDILKTIPVGRFGDAQDIARTVAFLTADEAGYITGADISVNGGLHM